MKANKTAIICLFIYSIITITKIINHSPWFDEAHAWTIAEQLNFIDMFNYVKNEGHFFIWQALLYPFAHSHIIPYPYPMQFLNWIFCFSALALMWWKAPFNNWIKALITFSFPFLGCYGVIARCYSIGILLLFILVSMENQKLKYPKIYALLLVLSANTNIPCLFASTALGLIFLYDLFKYKQLKKTDILLISSILTVGAVLILYQALNIGYWGTIVGGRTLHISVKVFRCTFIDDLLLPNLILLGIFGLVIFKYFWKNKKVIFFISCTYFLFLILCMGVYSVHFWHSYLFYIFLIMAYWLMGYAESCDDAKRNAMIIFGIISFIFIIHTPDVSRLEQVFNQNYSYKLLKFIEKDKLLNKALIIGHGGSLYEMLPYSYNKTYKFKNYCQVEDNTDYDLLHNIEVNVCPAENAMWQARRNPEILKDIVDENTYTYIKNEILETKGNLIEIKQDGYSFIFKKYKNFGKYSFWKIEVK